MSGGPMTPEEKWQAWFQGVWAAREDVVYPGIFGDIGKRIANVPASMFQGLGVEQVEPWELTHGVFTSPPQPGRPDWVYVTSGLSNPWGVDPADADRRLPSGLGFELAMQTTSEAPWAVPILHWLTAVQILAGSGRLKGELVRYGDLVPLGRSVDPDGGSALKNIFIAPPPLEKRRFELASGTVDILLCVGVTDAEHELAMKNGSDALLKLLKQGGAYPATDPGRASLA